MTRHIAVDAEVVRGRNQARTEVIQPQPIDDHASRQRVLGIGDPLSQVRSWCGSIIRQARRSLREQHAERSHRESFAGLVRIAAVQQMDSSSFLCIVLDTRYRWQRRGQLRLSFV